MLHLKEKTVEVSHFIIIQVISEVKITILDEENLKETRRNWSRQKYREQIKNAIPENTNRKRRAIDALDIEMYSTRSYVNVPGFKRINQTR